jgi:hypothetical protein
MNRRLDDFDGKAQFLEPGNGKLAGRGNSGCKSGIRRYTGVRNILAESPSGIGKKGH